MYLPDPIERMEARIDELIFKQTAGCPDGMLRCYDCGELIRADDSHAASDRPDAPAVCNKCVERRWGV